MDTKPNTPESETDVSSYESDSEIEINSDDSVCSCGVSGSDDDM